VLSAELFCRRRRKITKAAQGQCTEAPRKTQEIDFEDIGRYEHVGLVGEALLLV